jgi:hypothetical protein
VQPTQPGGHSLEAKPAPSRWRPPLPPRLGSGAAGAGVGPGTGPGPEADAGQRPSRRPARPQGRDSEASLGRRGGGRRGRSALGGLHLVGERRASQVLWRAGGRRRLLRGFWGWDSEGAARWRERRPLQKSECAEGAQRRSATGGGSQPPSPNTNTHTHTHTHTPAHLVYVVDGGLGDVGERLDGEERSVGGHQHLRG